MTTIDLYTQHYIGELEANLIQKDNSNNIIFEVRLFCAKFLSLLDYLPYDDTSHPQSINYLVNMAGQNWGELDYGLVYRLQEFHDQLLAVENQVNQYLLEEYNAVKQICISTLAPAGASVTLAAFYKSFKVE